MKRKLTFLLPIICLFLSSCFDIEETYQLNADGSYGITYNVDMSGLVGMANQMMPDSVKESPQYKVNTDTVAHFSSIPDSIKRKFNEKELNIINQTSLRTQMHMNAGVFKLAIASQGKSISELNYYLANFGKIFEKIKTNNVIMQPLPGAKMGEQSADSQGGIGDGESSMPFQNKEYDYIITENSFERKIRPDVLKAAREKNKGIYEMLKGMNVKMNSTVTINLPRPAISVDNPKAILSADRKQFKLVLDMIESTANPEMLNFKINY